MSSHLAWSAKSRLGVLEGIHGFLALILIFCPGETLRSQSPTKEHPSLSRYEFLAPHMGTIFRLVFFASDANGAKSAANAAFERVAEINRVLSDYDPDSEISRVEKCPPCTPFAASSDLFYILEQSRLIAERTHGAFDVTLGPLVGLWREARRTRRLPSESELSIARRACGAQNVHINSSNRTVTLLAPRMRFDFGGIAKGFAADEALGVLMKRGYKQAMVAAGGDLALGNPPPGTTSWRIDLAPFGSTSAKKLRINASNVGISTSGDSEQFVEINGIRYSHIINPATGLGLTASCAATVVAPDATQSDAWATACTILYRDQSIAACLPESVRVWIFKQEDGIERHESFGRKPPGLESE